MAAYVVTNFPATKNLPWSPRKPFVVYNLKDNFNLPVEQHQEEKLVWEFLNEYSKKHNIIIILMDLSELFVRELLSSSFDFISKSKVDDNCLIFNYFLDTVIFKDEYAMKEMYKMKHLDRTFMLCNWKQKLLSNNNNDNSHIDESTKERLLIMLEKMQNHHNKNYDCLKLNDYDGYDDD